MKKLLNKLKQSRDTTDGQGDEDDNIVDAEFEEVEDDKDKE